MTLILRLLKSFGPDIMSYLKIGVGLVVVLGLGYLIYSKDSEIEDLKSKNAELSIQITSLKADIILKDFVIQQWEQSLKQLQVATNLCNDVVDLMKNESDELATRIEEAFDDLELAKVDQKKRLDEINSSVIPEQYPEAMKWMANELQKMSTKWNSKK